MEMEKEKPVRNGKKIKRILARTGIALIILLAIFALAVTLVLNTIVTPKRITPLLLNLSKEYIKSEVKCESVDITFFSTFPNLGLKLQNGSISTEKDTLLAFNHVLVAVNPVAFLLERKLIIRQLEIENADIYAHVDTLGRPNWDIFISSADSVDTPADTTMFVMPELNIHNIRLNNVNLTYDDLRNDIFIMADSVGMRLNGNLTKEHANLSLGIRSTGITAYYQGKTFSRAMPFAFHTRLTRDRVVKTLGIDRGRIKVGTLELNTTGMLKSTDTPGVTDVDIDFELNASSLAELLKMIPEHLSQASTKLVAGGKITSGGKLTGQLGKENYPFISLSMQLENGTLASAKQPGKPFLEDFDLDFNTLLDLSGRQPSTLALKNLYLQTASSKLTVHGEFDNILTNPAIKASAKADVDFTQVARRLPANGMKMEGHITADFSAECLLSDILASNYGKINANGVLNIKDVLFDDPEQRLNFYTRNANIALGSYVQDKVDQEADNHLLRGKIVLDTLNLKWKEELEAGSSRLSALVTTTPPQDTSAIAPILIGSRIKNMRLNMGDSLRLRGVHAIGGIRIQPQPKNPALPELSIGLSLDTLMGKGFDMAGRISQANLKLRVAKQQPRQRDSLRRDTTLTRAQRDSLRKTRLDPTTNLSFQLESQETKELLRQWDISGELASKDISVRATHFPIPVRMRETDLAFTGNTLSLKKAHMRLGHSDFKLQGEIEGIRRALLFNGKVAAKFTLDADSIDFNEIIRAAVAGSNNTIAIDEDTTATGIFVVPRNLDVEFNSRIRNARFNDITVKNARGKIILRDQAIQLPRLMLNTDIGSAFVTMVYKAPNLRGAHLGMELGVKRINVKELIEAMPVMDEMAPMLRSFEGVVDCNITAVTELDSLMNVRLRETTASCFLSGQNLVLLDGETFSEISKTLMFKNKSRNLIDSVSVEMILEDEKLMIFPFQIAMDRYNAAVGGIQYLDLSFDYHITVLKSPIPFKLGLNISGTPEKMKIRLGKAKYKNMFTATREKNLGNTTINLRKEMDEKLRKSISEIAGTDLSRPLRRPRMEIPDSLIIPKDSVKLAE